ncbi:MAG: hypothetical protein ABIJ57_02320 [Pseudomonadota bacterium]
MSLFQEISTNTAGVRMFRWAGLRKDTACEILVFPRLVDPSIQVKGVFNTASVIIEGSNDYDQDGRVFFPLTSQMGDLIFTTPGGASILENVFQIRPRVSGGDDETNLTVTILAHTPK